MPKPASTQDNVARLDGVTRGTVSLVLSQRADSRVRIIQKRVGELAVQALIARIRSKAAAPQHITVPCDFVAGDTTAAASRVENSRKEPGREHGTQGGHHGRGDDGRCADTRLFLLIRKLYG